MKYPNLEVQYSLNTLFLEALTESDELGDNADYFIDALQSHDPEQIKTHLNALFASLPYTSYINNNMADYEGYYANSNKPIYLLGISFDPEQRLIDEVVLKEAEV